MKKALALVLFACLLCSCALAEEDALKNLSFDQLILMQKIVYAEIVSRPEWKQTKVPPGVWVVGNDIPAGSYAISASGDEYSYISIKTGSGILATTVISQRIDSEESAIGKVDLLEGYVITIEKNTLVFSPALSLQF